MMSEIHETAERLRELANEIDDVAKKISMPTQQVDIKGAFAKLRAALGKGVYLSIDPPAFNYHGHTDRITVDKWRVYDGHKSHEGSTLSEAVSNALTANAPNKEEDAEAAIEAVTESLAEPLPI